MRLLLLLFLAVSLPANAQAPAMRPPPVRPPPAHTPGYQPVAPADPVHTPPGAGASHGGLAEPGKQAPRSPNKRLLPPTKEAGLWAADGAPVASDNGSIFGAVVPLPQYPPHGMSSVLGVCGIEMEQAMRAVKMQKILSFPDAVRACMAASAYFRCVLRESQTSTRAGRPAPRGWDPVYLRGEPTRVAGDIVEKQCKDVAFTKEQGAAINAVLEKYTWGPKDLTME